MEGFEDAAVALRKCVLSLEKATTRLVGAIPPERNDEWSVGRRYLKLESIAPVSDNLNLMLPAKAA